VSERPDILARILRDKAEEVARRSKQRPLREVAARAQAAPAARPFADALAAHIEAGRPAVIAEIKKASPSRGVLRANFEPAAIAASYARAGAAALSVLTDERFFQGCDAHLEAARASSGLPVLRKDFVLDRYQIYEARALGADCVLLIVAALGDADLADFVALAAHLGMDALVEVHNREELERALAAGARLVGINNRDLRTFQTSLEITFALLEHVPDDRLVVTESGIHSREDVAALRARGVGAFLVGEAFMSAADPGARLDELFGKG